MFLNLTQETCTGTGDTLTLTGATTGNNAFGKTGNGEDGQLVACVVRDADGVVKVAGAYTFDKTANTLTRNDSWNDNGTTVDKNPATNIALSAGTHTVSCDIALANLRGRTVKAPGVGAFYTPQSVIRWGHTGAKGGGEYSSGAGIVCYTPITMYVPQTISSVGAYIETAEPGNFRIGLYRRNSDESVGELLFDSGDISTASVGNVFATLPAPIDVPVGDYYVADVVDNVVATSLGERLSSTGSSLACASTNGADDSYIKPRLTGDVYGPLASNPAPNSTTLWASFGALFK